MATREEQFGLEALTLPDNRARAEQFGAEVLLAPGNRAAVEQLGVEVLHLPGPPRAVLEQFGFEALLPYVAPVTARAWCYLA